MQDAEPPLLMTPRLRLRAFRREDAQDFLAYVTSEGFRTYLEVFDGREYALADAIEFVEMAANGPWGRDEHLAIEVDGRVIGATHLVIDRGAAAVGYGVGAPWRARGLATEAVVASIDRAFELSVEVVHARTHADNEASWRLLERLGFQLDGLLRRDRWHAGRRVDERVYSLLRDEWLASSAARTR